MLLPAIGKALQWIQQKGEKPLEKYITLATDDDETTFVDHDRWLVTVVRVIGTKDIKSNKDRQKDVGSLLEELKSSLASKGHGIEIHYSSDPDRGAALAEQQYAAGRTAAETIGLDMSNFVNAAAKHIGERCRAEDYFIVVWTGPTLLSKEERKYAMQEALEAASWWPLKTSRTAQNPEKALKVLRMRHKGFVKTLLKALSGVSVMAEQLTVREAGSEIYASLWQGESGRSFRLRLVGDRAPCMVYDGDDASDIMSPSISRQLAEYRPIRHDWETEQFGRRIFGAVDVVVGPEKPQDFSQLRDRLTRAGVPFRISMRMKTGGEQLMGYRAGLASFGTLFGGLNVRVSNAFKRIKSRVDDDGCVTWQLSAATWAPADDKRLLQIRMAELRSCISTWGNMQVRAMCGDPLQGVLSSAMGISLNSTAKMGYAPLAEVLTMMPHRVASPWKTGALPFLTKDQAIFPYEEGSDIPPYILTLIYAVMGSGKSVLLGRMCFANILSAGNKRLPYLVFLDLSDGSSGIIDVLREVLPPERRHEVGYLSMQMDERYSTNLLDLPLGYRSAPPFQIGLLTEAFSDLVTPAEATEGEHGQSDLVARCIRFAYALRDETADRGQPYLYDDLSETEPELMAAIRKAGIKTHTELGKAMPWYRIRDALFAAGEIHAAYLAQRYAVPTAKDLLLALEDEAIKIDYEDYKTRAGDSLVNAVRQQLKNALEQYPICKGRTRFDPTNRMIAINLKGVLGKGLNAAARKQTNIGYIWAMTALTRRWWTHPDDVAKDALIPPEYRKYQIELAEEMYATPKILVADEFHVTKSAPSVRANIMTMALEGRKYSLRLLLASQLLEHFDQGMRDLASAMFALSCNGEKDVKTLVDMYGLGEAHAEQIRKLGQRDPDLGQPVFMRLNTKQHGPFCGLVYSAMSPFELNCLASNPDETRLRRLLTQKLDFYRAVQLMASFEPLRRGIDEAIKLRITRHLEDGNAGSANKDAVIQEMAEEMYAIHREAAIRRLEEPA